MKEFYFVRHGQSQSNADNIIADAHSPLTRAGFDQARKTAGKLSYFNITAIISSPYLRAQQTAETIAAELGISNSQIHYVLELHERGFGPLEGKRKEHDSSWYFGDEAGPEAEPRAAVFDRMINCLKIIKELSATENVLVVGHAVSGYYLIQIAEGKSSTEEFDRASQLDNADFVKVSLPA